LHDVERKQRRSGTKGSALLITEYCTADASHQTTNGAAGPATATHPLIYKTRTMMVSIILKRK
jgi:hypothetical protein